jgi:hypothetical protein
MKRYSTSVSTSVSPMRRKKVKVKKVKVPPTTPTRRGKTTIRRCHSKRTNRRSPLLGQSIVCVPPPSRISKDPSLRSEPLLKIPIARKAQVSSDSEDEDLPMDIRPNRGGDFDSGAPTYPDIRDTRQSAFSNPPPTVYPASMEEYSNLVQDDSKLLQDDLLGCNEDELEQLRIALGLCEYDTDDAGDSNDTDNAGNSNDEDDEDDAGDSNKDTDDAGDNADDAEDSNEDVDDSDADPSVHRDADDSNDESDENENEHMGENADIAPAHIGHPNDLLRRILLSSSQLDAQIGIASAKFAFTGGKQIMQDATLGGSGKSGLLVSVISGKAPPEAAKNVFIDVRSIYHRTLDQDTYTISCQDMSSRSKTYTEMMPLSQFLSHWKKNIESISPMRLLNRLVEIFKQKPFKGFYKYEYGPIKYRLKLGDKPSTTLCDNPLKKWLDENSENGDLLCAVSLGSLAFDSEKRYNKFYFMDLRRLMGLSETFAYPKSMPCHEPLACLSTMLGTQCKLDMTTNQDLAKPHYQCGKKRKKGDLILKCLNSNYPFVAYGFKNVSKDQSYSSFKDNDCEAKKTTPNWYQDVHTPSKDAGFSFPYACLQVEVNFNTHKITHKRVDHTYEVFSKRERGIVFKDVAEQNRIAHHY